MIFNVNETIRRLVADYEARTLNERAILLFQLQTWIYFPTGGLADYAGALAATHFLQLYAGKYLGQTGPDRNDARQLKLALDDAEYCKIYDAFVKPIGGWTKLMRAPVPKYFGRQIAGSAKESVDRVRRYRLPLPLFASRWPKSARGQL